MSELEPLDKVPFHFMCPAWSLTGRFLEVSSPVVSVIEVFLSKQYACCKYLPKLYVSRNTCLSSKCPLSPLTHQQYFIALADLQTLHGRKSQMTRCGTPSECLSVLCLIRSACCKCAALCPICRG